MHRLLLWKAVGAGAAVKPAACELEHISKCACTHSPPPTPHPPAAAPPLLAVPLSFTFTSFFRKQPVHVRGRGSRRAAGDELEGPFEVPLSVFVNCLLIQCFLHDYRCFGKRIRVPFAFPLFAPHAVCLFDITRVFSSNRFPPQGFAAFGDGVHGSITDALPPSAPVAVIPLFCTSLAAPETAAGTPYSVFARSAFFCAHSVLSCVGDIGSVS